MKRILVINPNSNSSVTKGIDEAVEEQRVSSQVEIDCVTLHDAPFGIETDDDIAVAAELVRREVTTRHDDYDAFVIACYSDPGLDACRTMTAKPVLGIQESALAFSAAHERRFGVLALSRDSIQRHIAYVRSVGMQDFHAGERPLCLSVDEAANGADALDRIVTVGQELIDEDGAEALVLGCAGMAAHRKSAQARLGVPVIDPVQAAVTMASRALQ